MKATVYYGPPGIGKSFAIRENEQNVPVLDINDMRKQIAKKFPYLDSYAAYTERMDLLYEHILDAKKRGLEHIVIEGIFCPYTHSS